MQATGRKQDRRRAGRVRAHRDASVGRSGWPAAEYENAVVEDEGGGGCRIRSAVPLERDETVRLRLDEDGRALRAAVVWARPDGIIQKRASGKPGSAYLAGCRLLPSKGSAKRRPADPTRSRLADILAVAIKTAGVLVAIALVAAVVYAAVAILGLVA
jgi:hypothetical protein